MKKQIQKEQEKNNEVEKVNPYKMAKETGKSVEEIVAKTQKEKEKAEKANKHKKQNHNQGKPQVQKQEAELESDNKKVKEPRPISAGGSQYITGRKALAEEKAHRTKSTHPKNATGKSKNTKKK